MDIMEIYYMIMNKPYFKVYVLSNGRKIKTFIQLAAVSDDKNKAYIYFLICRPLRLAWRKPEKPIIDGVKFEAHVNLRNAIPLLIKTEKEYITEDYTINF